MNKTIIFFSLFIITSPSFSEVVPEHFFNQINNPELKDKVTYLNKKLSLLDFSICAEVQTPLTSCYDINPNAKYIFLIKENKVIAVRSEKNSFKKRLALEEEKVFFYYFINYFMKISEIRNSTETNDILNKSEKDFSLSNFGPFGPSCGSGPNAENIPDLFPESCARHDNCYGGTTAKNVCDDIFLQNMLDESAHISGLNVVQRLTLVSLAYEYYDVVATFDAAFLAFCNATQIPESFAECSEEYQEYLQDNLQHTENTIGGSFTGDKVRGLGDGFGTLGNGFFVMVLPRWFK